MTPEAIKKKFIPLKDPPTSTHKEPEIINFNNKIIENAVKNIIKIPKIDEISFMLFQILFLKTNY